MTKTKLVWRLSKLPTAEELRELVKDKIITQEEAREILFSEQNESERDIESFKSEIKFLRELVEKLSQNKSQIITTIKEIEVPVYRRLPWYQPYVTWGGAPYNATGSITVYNGQTAITSCSSNFSDIQTF